MTTEPVSPFEARIARLEGSYEQIDWRLSAPEARVDSGFADLRAEIRASRSETGAKLDRLDAKIDSRFNIVTFLGFFITAVQIATALGLFDRPSPQPYARKPPKTPIPHPNIHLPPCP